MSNKPGPVLSQQYCRFNVEFTLRLKNAVETKPLPTGLKNAVPWILKIAGDQFTFRTSWGSCREETLHECSRICREIKGYGLIAAASGKPTIIMLTYSLYGRHKPMSNMVQREINLLADVTVGSIAMLLAGPAGFTGLRSSLSLSGPSKAVWKYKGLSDFWLAGPEYLSLFIGLLRTCVDFQNNNLFPSINRSLNLSAIRVGLRRICKRNRFIPGDRRYIRNVLSQLRPIFCDPRLANTSRYPLNQNTWVMLTHRLTKQPLIHEHLHTPWCHGIYQDAKNSGFSHWCHDAQKRTMAKKTA